MKVPKDMAKDHSQDHIGSSGDGAPIRDLADFCLRWGEFRPAIARIGDHCQLDRNEREALSWLIHMADRVGPRDLT